MKREKLRPKKRLGQNFLYDPAIAARIVAAAGVEAGTVAVELGPGRGILTDRMVECGARVIAVELDRALAEELRGRYAGAGDRVEIIEADFRDVRLSTLLAERGLERCALIGNIPYYLTREVLFDFLFDEFAVLDSACIMMQREVGARIAAGPGSRVYGVTSVLLQSLYRVRQVLKVAPGSFFPPPKVASVVLEFQPLESPPMLQGEREPFRSLVRSVFQQRRKTIQNSLRASYELGETEWSQVYVESGIDPGARPEALDMTSFIRLSRALTKACGNR